MFWGLGLVFVGIVLLLERLDVIHVGIGRLWPVLLIILGIAMLANAIRARRWRR